MRFSNEFSVSLPLELNAYFVLHRILPPVTSPLILMSFCPLSLETGQHRLEVGNERKCEDWCSLESVVEMSG